MGARLSNPRVNPDLYLSDVDIYELRRAVIRRVIDLKFDGNQAAFAKAAVMEPSYVSRVLATEEGKAKKRLAEDLARRLESIPALGLRPGELVDPHPPSRNEVREKAVSYEVEPRNVSRRSSGDLDIAHFDSGGAMGHGVLLRDQPGVIQSWRVTREWVQKNVKSYSAAENLCIVTGFGDSMRPLFNPGDPLLVDIGVRSVEFDAIYFFRVGEEGFIKRLQRIPQGNSIVLRALSANRENYEPWTVTSDMDFEVFGRVLKVWCSEDF